MTTKQIELTGRGALRLPRGVTFTKTALLIDQDVTPQEWAEVGDYLAAASRACGQWTGDWVRHGRANYDAGVVAVTIGQLELPLHAVERFELMADVAPESRREELTPEHHLVAAKRLTEPAEREDWLERAARLGLTPRELQASIRAGEVVRIDEAKRRGGMASPYAVRAEFDAWAREIGESWQCWPAQDLQEVADALRPVAEMREKLLRTGDEVRFGPEVEKAEKLKAEKLKGDE